MTPEEIFGGQLKNIRKEKKITQEALAKAIGVHTGTVSHWENGKQLPDTSTMQRIADYLGVSIGELLNETVYNAPYYGESSDVNLEALVTQLKALSRESLQIIAPAIRAAYEIEKKRSNCVYHTSAKIETTEKHPDQVSKIGNRCKSTFD